MTSGKSLEPGEQVSLSGRTLKIVRLLGQGTLGASYLADEGGIPIVLKLFNPEYSETFSQRFHLFKESTFSSTASVYGYQAMGIEDGQPYVLHEYVEARTFNEFAVTFKFTPKKPEPAAEVGAKLCQALAPLHAAGIIHGHLWNTNLFFGEYGDPLIVDPFIGAPTSNDLVMSSLPLPQLSPMLAPEQKDVNGTLDPRTDIWHLGALLCRLLTGKPDLAINDVVLRELRRAKVPISLIRVIWQATHKDPSSRFADIGTLETALAEAFFPEHRKTVHVRLLPATAPGPCESSHALRNLLLGAVVIAGVIGVGWWLSGAGTPGPATPALAISEPTPSPEARRATFVISAEWETAPSPSATVASARNLPKGKKAGMQYKTAQDLAKYTPEQLREAERLYQVANQKWGSTEAKESLQNMIKKYPDINRAGCALLYVAQQSSGEERANYLKQCIEKHNDCFYGDGVQVGAFARFLLAKDYSQNGKQKKAAALYKEIRTNYADAVDHRGKLLVDSIKTEAR